MVNNTKIYNLNDHSPELAIYLKDIARYKLLTREEEKELAPRIREGDKGALDKLVKSNLRFVVNVASNYQNQGLPLVDLINEGNLGLIKAAERFDEKKKVKFISYAVWWIRQGILQGLADYSRIVKVPLNRVAHIHKIGKTIIYLEQKYHREPYLEEISEELSDIPEKNITTAMKINSKHSSFDAPLPSEEFETTSLYDVYYDENQEKTDDEAIRKSISELTEKTLETVSGRDILKLYYGLNDNAEYTLKEIGKRKGITKEGVRQIRDKAKKKIEKSARGKELFEHTLN